MNLLGWLLIPPADRRLAAAAAAAELDDLLAAAAEVEADPPSSPLEARVDQRAVAAAQCAIAAEMSAALGGGKAAIPADATMIEPMKLPGVRPGDARYAGPPARPGRVSHRFGTRI